MKNAPGSLKRIERVSCSPTVERGWSEIDAHGWVKAEFVKAEPRKTQDYSQPDYENMTVPELKKLAEERGLEVKAKATKADLVAALEGDE